MSEAGDVKTRDEIFETALFFALQRQEILTNDNWRDVARECLAMARALIVEGVVAMTENDSPGARVIGEIRRNPNGKFAPRVTVEREADVVFGVFASPAVAMNVARDHVGNGLIRGSGGCDTTRVPKLN